jgi:hypothetical protein
MDALAESPTLKLYDKGRPSRRTIADALEILRSIPGFCKSTRSTIRTAALRLRSGEVPFLVQVVCEDVGWVISLPTSEKFRAKLLQDGSTPASDSSDFIGETALLEGAIVDDECQVTLSDGRRLRGVEMIPARMPPHGDGKRDMESIRLRDAVIGHIVRMKKAEDRHYRYLHKDLLPGVRALDYSTLQDLEPDSLSEIMHDIQLNNAVLNEVSRQTVANILRTSGMRLPKPRRRHH